MQFTDQKIKLIQTQALINDAIENCHAALIEVAQVEALCQVNRAKFETYLGDLLAKKLLILQAL